MKLRTSILMTIVFVLTILMNCQFGFRECSVSKVPPCHSSDTKSSNCCDNVLRDFVDLEKESLRKFEIAFKPIFFYSHFILIDLIFHDSSNWEILSFQIPILTSKSKTTSVILLI
ncbi:MAG: hypothetical protein KDK54_12950 [Leptospiraceae bacterium]|nr:hypothetical protein [Leptospiraceae bacterium]